ncbi:glycosyltransferase family 2 protein [Proteiniclasticum ruminis]|uniref:Teichuronic acid biosynthesis glycosyltransferase TuaG n=1 Tax=Proteiniclasticum ruminis TaxID=398199 RepID=A0A1G8JND8_9CLOT|nr:glycosyltransferase family 2 protein [Proteiniclasticum ruminis]SDI32692.1 teichuronic acid biosynthesis glycosyltransferase TuaG [Proteiniclasticum ruminis]
MDNKQEHLISIIMPTFNADTYLVETIDSVLAQDYRNWELIIIDDCSTDKTKSIILEYAKVDPRIKSIYLAENQGAAIARNSGVKIAKGDFIAFIDSDDVWHSNKLSDQLNFMVSNKYYFSCTYYQKMSESGEPLDVVVKSPQILDYYKLLRRCPGNSTVMYNSLHLGKFYIPNIRRRNDFVMWLQVIKEAKTMHTLQTPLTYHRVREGSLSSKKSDLVRYQWQVYRHIEKLPLWISIGLLLDKFVQTITLSVHMKLQSKIKSPNTPKVEYLRTNK